MFVKMAPVPTTFKHKPDDSNELGSGQHSADHDRVVVGSSDYDSWWSKNTTRLIILSDNRGSCPCAFVHLFLPPGLPYSYMSFQDPEDLQKIINETSKATTTSGAQQHYLIVMRSSDDLVTVGEFSQRKQQETKSSFGLFHMSDEKLNANYSDYLRFDYVLRHYFSHEDRTVPHLRALGNHTCGTTSPTSPGASEQQPKFGTHWVFQRYAGTTGFNHRHQMVYRTRNCSFIGRSTHERRLMVQTLKQAFNDSDGSNNNRRVCHLEFTIGFGQGHDPFEYYGTDLGNSKIVLNPAGNNVETIRLGEMIELGTVPAMLDAPFLHATFQRLPGIIQHNWLEVSTEIMRLLDHHPRELQSLSDQIFMWQKQYMHCCQMDMKHILQQAFGLVQ